MREWVPTLCINYTIYEYKREVSYLTLIIKGKKRVILYLDRIRWVIKWQSFNKQWSLSWLVHWSLWIFSIIITSVLWPGTTSHKGLVGLMSSRNARIQFSIYSSSAIARRRWSSLLSRPCGPLGYHLVENDPQQAACCRRCRATVSPAP